MSRLRGARALLERGVTKGVYHDPGTGYFCWLGALNAAYRPHPSGPAAPLGDARPQLGDADHFPYMQDRLRLARAVLGSGAMTAMEPWSLPDTESALTHAVITEWNDANGRTVDEVLAAWDAAIADLDAQDAPG